MRPVTLAAPRILKEPMGWRFSSLRRTSAGASALRGTRGVRTMVEAMAARASRA